MEWENANRREGSALLHNRWVLGGLAVAAAVLVTFIVHFTRRIVRRREKPGAVERYFGTVETLIRSVSLIVVFLLALYGAAYWLGVEKGVLHVLHGVAVVALLVQLGIWGNHLVGFAIERYLALDPNDRTARASVQVARIATQALLWGAIALTALEFIGINITALVAGFGIGSVAAALAVQNILGDVFASVSIAFDRPFVVGDFITIDTLAGTVEYIGVKSTRVRSLGGEIIVFSNADLLKSRIRNYQHMLERRIVFTLGVTYDTGRDKLELIPQIVREAIEAEDGTRFDRAHFKLFGPFSLDFEVVYYVTVPDYTKYMDVQQAINFAILKRFDAEGIAFAFPSQTIYVAPQLGGRNGRRPDRQG